ncbi:putative Tetratricopeptide TPR 2 repeat protein [Magnetofaba australis IT-1]|uniref:Putative Tetratricopeptide TPR 2 repeat protein n=1 Tax=Magnetofaba australis IT-1 TaxID=1434232 RepID=A0A1Y2K3N6_9PROT|nr:putative Tetratricopeptide TPR 2 repeat protein [Magnetofaba australis IT-1]
MADKLDAMLPAFSRSLSITARLRIMALASQLGSHQFEELEQILNDETNKYREVSKLYWYYLLERGIVSWFDWLDAWIKRRELDERAVLEAVINGERDETLGDWGGFPAFWFKITDTLEQRGYYDLAEKSYRRAVEIDAGYAMAWNALGHLLKNHLGRVDEAEACYRRAIDLDPLFYPPWLGLGNLQRDHRRQFDEAEKSYRKAIFLAPNAPNLWFTLGTLLRMHTDRAADAEEALRKANELDAHDAFTWDGLGKTAARQGRLEDARKAWLAALEEDEDNPDYLHNIAEMELTHGDLDACEKALDQAVPMLTDARQSRSHHMMRLALGLARESGDAVARAHAELSAIQEDPELIPSGWNYDDMQPLLDRMPDPCRILMQAWINKVRAEPGDDPQESYDAFRDALARGLQPPQREQEKAEETPKSGGFLGGLRKKLFGRGG